MTVSSGLWAHKHAVDSHVSERAGALGTSPGRLQPHVTADAPAVGKAAGLEDRLAHSDFVSLHARATAAKRDSIPRRGVRMREVKGAFRHSTREPGGPGCIGTAHGL